MMLKRTLAVASGAITVATAGALIASLTPAGAGAFHAVGNAVASAVSENRPLVDANGGGGGGSGSTLPPIDMHIGSTATLTSKLTVNVHLTVQCGPFLREDYSFLDVELSEAAGHTVAQAYGQKSPLPCDGYVHRLTVQVAAQNVPFRPGSGEAQAYAEACGVDTTGNSNCQDGSTSREVSIKK